MGARNKCDLITGPLPCWQNRLHIRFSTFVADGTVSIRGVEEFAPKWRMRVLIPWRILEQYGRAVELMMTDAIVLLLNQALTVGSGVGSPQGFVTAPAGGASEHPRAQMTGQCPAGSAT